jgi:ribosomal protein S18 acetylase RimI-like enzyme
VSTVVLNLARLGDAPAIANMSRRFIESGLPWSWTPRRVAALIRQRECLAVVAKSQRDMIGFVMAQFGNDSVHIALLGVAEGYRRQGVARRLIAWVEESAVVAGLFHVRLEVRQINRSARRFYASLGYTESGRVVNYYSGHEDAIRLSRDLRSLSCSK